MAKAPKQQHKDVGMRITTVELGLAEHLLDCKEARRENKRQNEQIIRTQGEQGVLLTDLQEVLPWLKQNYADKKARDDMWRAVGGFVAGMAKKNWDSISGKLIFVALGAFAVYKGVPWTSLLPAMFGG
jgi:hypothetical protein